MRGRAGGFWGGGGGVVMDVAMIIALGVDKLSPGMAERFTRADD